MSLLKNRAVAWCLSALIAAGAPLGLGGWKLHGQRKQAEEAFFTGQNGFSPYNDLMNRRDSAYNLLTLAQKGLDQNSQAVKQAQSAWNQLDRAETPKEYHEANSYLQGAVDALYQQLESALTEEDWQIARRQYADFCGRMSNLQYDDYYNGLAEDYNRVCDGFPASVIGALTGAGKLPTFR